MEKKMIHNRTVYVLPNELLPDTRYLTNGLPKSTSTTSSVRTLGPGPPITTTPASPLPVPKNEKSTEDGRADSTGSLVGRCLPCCAAMRCCRRTPKEQADVEQKKKEDLGKMDEGQDKKAKFIEKINCFKKRKPEPLPPEASSTLEVPKLQPKAESSPNIELAKPSLFDCICCKRRNKIGDSSSDGLPSKSDDRGWICCKRSSKRNRSMADRRDSILSQPQPPGKCCGRASTLLCCLPSACCRRKASEESAISRRTSNFSKNKSLSPTLPTEDTRPKLDVSLVEHTSTMRGALPALPIPLAWICLVCNVIVPGLGTVLSGLFCLCFGVPRFGIYDGFRPRVGSFIINLFIGCGQLFTVLFCLVGWGWSIWWGVILLRVARKYRKLKQAEGRGEAEAGRAPPPITAQNHRVD